MQAEGAALSPVAEARRRRALRWSAKGADLQCSRRMMAREGDLQAKIPVSESAARLRAGCHRWLWCKSSQLLMWIIRTGTVNAGFAICCCLKCNEIKKQVLT